MSNKIKNIVIFTIMFTATLISSCGLHLRPAKNIPSELRNIYLETPHPYIQFTSDLKNLLRAMHIHLAKNRKAVPITLKISDYTYTHSNLGITSTSVAVSYLLRLSVRLQLVTKNNKPITQARTFSTSRSLILSSDQIFTPGIDTLAKREMVRELTIMIYQWLSSTDVNQSIENK